MNHAVQVEIGDQVFAGKHAEPFGAVRLVHTHELVIDIENKPSVTLTRHLGFTVPKGVVHRTRAAVKTVILMVEGATVTPTGDEK